jgi:hypothetical protein
MQDPLFWQAVAQGLEAAGSSMNSSYATSSNNSYYNANPSYSANTNNSYSPKQSNYPSNRYNTTSSINGLGALEGAAIIANDGQYLGKITWNDIDSESIMNDIGKYGSDISSLSIMNDIGKYGSDISPLSPWNDITSTPPKIITKDKRWIYLTTNNIMSPRIDPHMLIAMIKQN